MVQFCRYVYIYQSHFTCITVHTQLGPASYRKFRRSTHVANWYNFALLLPFLDHKTHLTLLYFVSVGQWLLNGNEMSFRLLSQTKLIRKTLYKAKLLLYIHSFFFFIVSCCLLDMTIELRATR